MAKDVEKAVQKMSDDEEGVINTDDLSDSGSDELESVDMQDMSDVLDEYEEDAVDFEEDDDETVSSSGRRSIYNILEGEIASSFKT